MGYGRFFAMIATSTIVMYGLMYLNTYLYRGPVLRQRFAPVMPPA